MKQHIQYLRSTLYRDLVSSPLHIWLFLYLISLAFTNVRLYAGLTTAEILFLLVIPFLLFTSTFRKWVLSGKWNTDLNKVVLLYLAAIIFSVLYAICKQVFLPTIYGCYFYLLFLTGFFFIQHYNDRTIRVLVAGLSLAGFISIFVSVFGIAWSLRYQENSFTAWYYRDYPYFGNMARARGFLSTPTMMALLVGTGLLLKLPYYLEKRRNKALEWLLVIDIIGLLMTSSKVILSVLAGVALILMIKKIISKALAISSIVVLTCLLLISTHFLFYRQAPGIDINPKVTGDLLFHFQGYDVYASSYLALKIGSLQAIADLFPLGTGYGCHFQYLENLISQGKFSAAIGSGNPHSVYTGLVAESGLPGLIFLCLLIFVLVKSFRKLFSVTGTANLNITCFLAGFFVFFGIEALCSDLLNQRYFWVVLGVLAGLPRQGRH